MCGWRNTRSKVDVHVGLLLAVYEVSYDVYGSVLPKAGVDEDGNPQGASLTPEVFIEIAFPYSGRCLCFSMHELGGGGVVYTIPINVHMTLRNAFMRAI